MGLFCKGLHCAGCGKGFPVGILAAIILLVMAIHNHIMGAIGALIHDLEMIALFLAIGAAVFAVIIVIALRGITMVRPVMGMKWEGETQTEIKANSDEFGELVPQWPNRSALALVPAVTNYEDQIKWANGDREKETAPIPIPDTWT